MPVKMGVDPERLKAPKPVPGNQWYKLKFKGFRPKQAKAKDGSINFNAELEVVESAAENNGTKIYMTLSTKFERALLDFSHGLGFPLNADGTFPGTWAFDDKDPENVEKAQYTGPLLGKTMDAELITSSYQGNERNEIKQIRCKVEGCAVKFPDIKHITNLVGNK